MSEWITHRLPTKEDADDYGYVWISDRGKVVHTMWDCVTEDNQAWTHFTRPAPYAKPKRWNVVWSDFRQCWALRDYKSGATIFLRDEYDIFGLINRYDKHREAAERIAAIYEEVMP